MLINKLKKYFHHPWQIAVWLAMTVFFCLTAWRIINLSIVHDEAVSLEMFSHLSMLDMLDPAKTSPGNMMANHHLLNSLLMKIGYSLFGYQEFAVRLSAWLAIIIYLLALYLITKLLAHKFLAFLFVLFMCSNPFLLDFLVLARGYGLAVALMLLACYYLFSFNDIETGAKKIFASILLASLAVLANYIMIFFMASLLVVWFVKLFWLQKIKLSLVVYALLYYGLAGLLIVLILAWPQINYMASRGGQFLFFGGSAGLWLNSITSLITASLYHGNYDQRLNVLLALLVFLCLVFAVVWSLWLIRKRQLGSLVNQMMFCCLIILLTNAFLITINHALTNTLFPMERAALWLLVLFYLLLATTVSSVWETLGNPRIVWFFAVVVLLATIHLLIVLKPNQTYTWPYCRDARSLYQAVITGATDKVKLVTSWELMPSFFFYANKFNDPRIHFVVTHTRAKPQSGNDIYLLLSTDYDVIKQYHLKEVPEKSTADIIYAIKP